jgi:hypothetical protein
VGRTRLRLPVEVWGWITPELETSLLAIEPPSVSKKINTLLLVAWAMSTNIRLKQIWARDDTCNEATWYRSWKKREDVALAYAAALERCKTFRIEETARLIAHYTAQYQRELAAYCANAPMALAAVMSDPTQRGADRIEAATRLIKFADPGVAGQVGFGGSLGSVDVHVVNELDEQIRQQMRRLGIMQANGSLVLPADLDSQSDSEGQDDGFGTADH